MAQKVEVLLLDDLDGSEASETVRFGLDGTSYEIDLSDKNAGELRAALHPFLQAARRDRAARTTRRGSSARGQSDRERSAEIREWARARGIKINDRGRIPASVVEQYEAGK